MTLQWKQYQWISIFQLFLAICRTHKAKNHHFLRTIVLNPCSLIRCSRNSCWWTLSWIDTAFFVFSVLNYHGEKGFLCINSSWMIVKLKDRNITTVVLVLIIKMMLQNNLSRLFMNGKEPCSFSLLCIEQQLLFSNCGLLFCNMRYVSGIFFPILWLNYPLWSWFRDIALPTNTFNIKSVWLSYILIRPSLAIWQETYRMVSSFLFRLFHGEWPCTFIYSSLILNLQTGFVSRNIVWFMRSGIALSQMLYHPHFLWLCGINSSPPVTNAKNLTLQSLTTGSGLKHPFWWRIGDKNWILQIKP